jgi:hypothetical protein
MGPFRRASLERRQRVEPRASNASGIDAVEQFEFRVGGTRHLPDAARRESHVPARSFADVVARDAGVKRDDPQLTVAALELAQGRDEVGEVSRRGDEVDGVRERPGPVFRPPRPRLPNER